MLLRPGTKELIRDLNTNLVLNVLRRFAPCSRAELCEHTRLSRSTVHAILTGLEGQGMLERVSVAASSGGRPAGLLRLAPQARLSAGFALDGATLTGVLLDLYGLPLVRMVTAVPTSLTPLGLANEMRTMLTNLVREGDARDRLTGVGLALQALIEPATGQVVESNRPGWQDAPLGHLLREVLALPVLVVGLAQAYTLAEWHHGTRPGATTLAAVWIDSEIRAGLIASGQFYHGATPGTGALGHLPVRAAKGRCRCGRRGCLQTVASIPAVLAAAGLPVNALDQAPYESLPETPQINQALAAAGEALGQSLIPLANLLSPELIVLGGSLPAAGGARLMEPLRHALRGGALPLIGQSLQVLTSRLGPNAIPIGAGMAALEDFFRPPLYDSAPIRS